MMKKSEKTEVTITTSTDNQIKQQQHSALFSWLIFPTITPGRPKKNVYGLQYVTFTGQTPFLSPHQQCQNIDGT